MDDHEGRSAFHRDPLADPLRWEALVGSVLVAVGPELARRREGVGVVRVVLDWARPALSAAATVAILVSTALAVSRLGNGPSEPEPLAAALVPEEVAAWLMAGYQPTVTELVLAVEDVSR